MRIRTVKPDFFKHESLFDAEKQSGLPCRLAFEGLWCASDREGRFKWRPRQLKVEILPYDDLDFSRVLDALVTRGFVVKYRVGDDWYGWIPSFKRHQVVNNRESDSILPDVSESSDVEHVDDASVTRGGRVGDASKAEGKGREGNKEGKGKEEKGRGTPTLEQVKLCCAKAGLPESDAIWFFNKCEGNGWLVNGRPIKSWMHVIAAWKAAGYMASQKGGRPTPSGTTTFKDGTPMLPVREI